MFDNSIAGFSSFLHPLCNREAEAIRPPPPPLFGTCVGDAELARLPALLAISRTRISCLDALERTACAPFREERRMKFTEATKFHRKSGGEPRPLERPQQHQQFREKQKILLHEELVRLVRTF